MHLRPPLLPGPNSGLKIEFITDPFLSNFELFLDVILLILYIFKAREYALHILLVESVAAFRNLALLLDGFHLLSYYLEVLGHRGHLLVLHVS